MFVDRTTFSIILQYSAIPEIGEPYFKKPYIKYEVVSDCQNLLRNESKRMLIYWIFWVGSVQCWENTFLVNSERDSVRYSITERERIQLLNYCWGYQIYAMYPGRSFALEYTHLYIQKYSVNVGQSFTRTSLDLTKKKRIFYLYFDITEFMESMCYNCRYVKCLRCNLEYIK
jgi:hypothetical protein